MLAIVEDGKDFHRGVIVGVIDRGLMCYHASVNAPFYLNQFKTAWEHGYETKDPIQFGDKILLGSHRPFRFKVFQKCCKLDGSLL
jgi:hypothetical protein